MYQTASDPLQLPLAAFEIWRNVALRSLDAVERMNDLNVQSARENLEEAQDQWQTLMNVHSAQTLGEIATSSMSPAAERMAAYMQHVFDISREAGTELAHAFGMQGPQTFEPLQLIAQIAAPNSGAAPAKPVGRPRRSA